MSIDSGSVVADLHNSSGFGDGRRPLLLAISTGCLRVSEAGQSHLKRWALLSEFEAPSEGQAGPQWADPGADFCAALSRSKLPGSASQPPQRWRRLAVAAAAAARIAAPARPGAQPGRDGLERPGALHPSARRRWPGPGHRTADQRLQRCCGRPAPAGGRRRGHGNRLRQRWGCGPCAPRWRRPRDARRRPASGGGARPGHAAPRPAWPSAAT